MPLPLFAALGALASSAITEAAIAGATAAAAYDICTDDDDD